MPFCRLDPAEDPLAEAERCLAAGARGIKLHPRAQDFVFDGAEMDDVFALAEEAAVPILIHAGRGLPPLADGLADLALRHPGAVLILAHGAICDQGILTTRLADHPGVLYDISCFFPLDVIELFARVPAERIVFASDPPYGMPATTLYLALRVARQAGLDEQATQGRARRHDGRAARRRRAAAGHAAAPRRHRSRSRAGSRACTATRASSARRCSRASLEQAHAMLDMAIAACRDPEPGADGEALETIGAALARGRRAASTKRTACARRSTSCTARSCARRPRSPTASEPIAGARGDWPARAGDEPQRGPLAAR